MGVQGRVLVLRDEDGHEYTTRQEVTVSSVVTDMMMASIAATGATLMVHPVDMAKIRIQMQGELMRHGEYKVNYRNVPHAVYQIMKHDGVRSIYRGIIPATFYQIISQGFRLGLFQTIEDLGLTMDSNLEPSITKSAISGGICGAVSAFIGSPFFMVKSYQMIRSASKIRIAHQREYTNMVHAFYDIYRSYPLSRGLWRATGSNVLRIGVGSSVQLSSFVGIKNVLNLSVDYNERFLVFNTMLAALASSMLVSPIIASLDLVRARMYIQPVDANGRGLLYKSTAVQLSTLHKQLLKRVRDGPTLFPLSSSNIKFRRGDFEDEAAVLKNPGTHSCGVVTVCDVWDCVRRIRAREGLLGFWKGSTGAFFYVMITSSITLVSWDEMRHVRNARLNSRDYVIDFGYQ